MDIQRRLGLVHQYGRKIIGSRNEYCHQMVAETAQELCGAQYDAFAQNNEFYKLHPSREAYIAAGWGLYVAFAREALAGLLGSTLPPDQKEIIYEAILLDRELVAGRAADGIQLRFN